MTEQRRQSLPVTKQKRITNNRGDQLGTPAKTKQNAHIGKRMENINETKTLRVYHQNIRGAKLYSSWSKWKEGFQWLREQKVGIASLAETNTNWTHNNKSEALKIAKLTSNSATLTTSGSMESRISDYQPGGTGCALLNKWSGHSTQQITDKKLGRWSGYILRGKNNLKIVILSAYRPTLSADVSDFTCYSQQWRIIRNDEEGEPNPRAKFMTDLSKLIKNWENDNCEILICADMNESCNNNSSSVTKLIENSSLINLMEDTEEETATYDRGTKCIDCILGTPRIKNCITASGYLPFYTGGWLSDHRGMYIDIEIQSLFTTINTDDITNGRILSSNHWINANKFVKGINNNQILSTLLAKIKHLETIIEWSKEDEEKLESIDQKFTKTLTQTEKHCCRKTDTYWSDSLKDAILINKYWKILIKGRTNNVRITEILLNIRASMTTEEAIWQGDKGRPAKNQLKRSVDILVEIRKNAWENRVNFLLKLQHRYKTLKDKKRETAIVRIRKSEMKKRATQVCKNVNKPRGQSGGISKVIIDTPGGEELIDDPVEMEKYLIDRNITHFSQAKNTPCASGNLATVLGNDGLSDTVQQALKGEVDNNTPHEIKTILHELKQVRSPLSSNLPFAAMITGFKRWKEKTTTSPSGKHLGMYKTLIKMHEGFYTKNNKSKEGSKEQTQTELILKANATTALEIQHKLMNLAIKHCHTYRRWQTIHNFFIEKIPGRPHVSKLRVIHIYEADWNLLAKYFVSHKVHNRACKERTVQTEQTGGRPGKSAAHGATTSTLTMEIIGLQKLKGAILYNDAAACFDRIIENISNATLVREGLNQKIARLHSQTLTTCNYHLKTKNGISKQSTGHMRPEPFLGSGQGAADSMPRWAMLSDLLIRIYIKQARTRGINSPFTKKLLSSIIKAYVDDTHATMIGATLAEVISMVRFNATLWERILYIIGGKMEITKCKFVIFDWIVDDSGTLILNNNKSTDNIKIKDSESNQVLQIDEICTTEPYKLLGINNCPLLAEKGQKQLLVEKANRMKNLIKTICLHRTEMTNCWNTIILPTMKYGQSAMVLSKKSLEDIQKPISFAILPTMGLNRHYPRALVYASTSVGGIGLQCLYTEQGLAQIMFLMGGWRRNDETSQLIRTLIESYIALSGIVKNPFEDTRIIPYVQSSWVDTVKTFLQHINGSIKINNLGIQDKLRVRDEPIMERALKTITNLTKLHEINNCRIYLQLLTMAELVDVDGCFVNNAVLNGTIDSKGRRQNDKYTISLHLWPDYPRPPAKAWRSWKKWIKVFLRPNTQQLKYPLHRWLTDINPHRIWYNMEGKVINDIIPVLIKANNRQNSRRNQSTMQSVSKMIKILISYRCTEIKNKWQMTWAIGDNLNNMKIHRHTTPKLQGSGKERGNLLTLAIALNYIMECHHLVKSTPPPGQLTIITPTIKAEKYISEMGWNEPTIYQLTRSEASLTEQIRLSLSIFKDFSVIGPQNTNLISKGNLSLLSDAKDPKFLIMELRRMNKELVMQDIEISSAKLIDTPTIELSINNTIITGSIHETVRKEASINQYNRYISDKYGWNNICINNIDWEVIAIASAKTDKSHKVFTSKLMHGWLPTRGHPGFADINFPTKMCPICNATVETNQHFLECNINNEVRINQLYNKIIDLQPKTDIQTTLANTIKQTLMAQEINIPDKYNTIEAEQSCIGWYHLCLGRLTGSWATEYDKETKDNKGKKWLASIVNELWKYHRYKWEDRCVIAHDSNSKIETDNNDKVNQQINDLYSQYNNLDVVDKRLLSLSEGERTKLPLQQKIEWVQRTKHLIIKGVKRNKERLKNTNHTITEFFNRTQTSNKITRNTIPLGTWNNLITNGDRRRNRIRKENFKPP
jgi:hypothetical protein